RARMTLHDRDRASARLPDRRRPLHERRPLREDRVRVVPFPMLRRGDDDHRRRRGHARYTVAARLLTITQSNSITRIRSSRETGAIAVTAKPSAVNASSVSRYDGALR